jgi:Uma2 family endonuclease
MDVVLDRDRHLVVQPDVLFVAASRDEIVTDRIEGAPDLVIDVLSPRPRIGLVEEKVTWYARYGVRECWLVDLDCRQIAILAFEDGRVTGRGLFGSQEPIRSGVFPSLSLRPAAVFGWW